MSRTLWVGCRGGDVAAVQDALNQIGANAALQGQQTALPRRWRQCQDVSACAQSESLGWRQDLQVSFSGT